MRVIDCGRGRTCDGVGGRPIAPNVGIGGVVIFTAGIGRDAGGGEDVGTMRAGTGGGFDDARAGSGGGTERPGGIVFVRRIASIVVVGEVSATDDVASAGPRARQSTA